MNTQVENDMKRITLRHATLAIALAGAVLVAGCRSEPEPVIENTTVNIVETVNAMETNAALPVDEPVTNVAPPPANPGSDLTTDAQTMDDADATGMTSKLPSDEETQPAEESKK